MKLTQPQENFIVSVHGGATHYDAYLNAYPNARGWKRASVDVQCNKIMNNPKIVLRYKELKERAVKKVEVTHDILTTELLKVALFDVRTLFDTVGNLKGIQYMDEIAGKTISSIKTRRVITGKGEDKEVAEIIEVKLNDKGKFIDMLAKHVGYYEKDNTLDINGAVQYIIKKSARRERPKIEIPHEPSTE